MRDDPFGMERAPAPERGAIHAVLGVNAAPACRGTLEINLGPHRVVLEKRVNDSDRLRATDARTAGVFEVLI